MKKLIISLLLTVSMATYSNEYKEQSINNSKRGLVIIQNMRY